MISLPNELINKVLMYRPKHPMCEVLDEVLTDHLLDWSASMSNFQGWYFARMHFLRSWSHYRCYSYANVACSIGNLMEVTFLDQAQGTNDGGYRERIAEYVVSEVHGRIEDSE